MEADALATALPDYFAVPIPPIVRRFPTEPPQLEPHIRQERSTGALPALAYHYIGQDAFERLLEGVMATNYEILDRYITRRADQLEEQRVAQEIARARRDDLLKAPVNRLGSLPAGVAVRLIAATDPARLDAWFDLAPSTPTLDGIVQALDTPTAP